MRRGRGALVVLAVGVPVAWSSGGAARLASWYGDRLASDLARAMPVLPSPEPPIREPVRVAAARDPEAPRGDGEETGRDPSRAGAPGHGGSLARPIEHGLHVSAAQVLRIARAGVIPTGEWVGPTAARPGGMRLNGVGALGVGLQDGDVLTDVAGVPATSAADVVSVVIAARKRRVSSLSGRVWRGDVPWQLVVEMPYPR